MIFGQFPRDEALGVVLAHTLRVAGQTLRKGRLLDEADLVALAREGIDSITGARLDADDLAEDVAAAQIARLLAGERLAPRTARTGRCNLHAGAAGVLVIDRDRIDRLNLVDEAITVASLPPFSLVRRGQVAATVKIIPFAIPKRLMAACRRVVAGDAPLRLAPLVPHRVALVITDRPGLGENVIATTSAVTRERVEALGSRLELELRCRHEPVAVQRAIAKAIAAGCDLVLVSGATVTKDRGDVVPSAIVAAGGSIEHFGMPVEPGNMLLLARIGRVPVVNLPGCGRSRRLNGLDWVLHRLLAKLPLSRTDIMLMGVGGLIRAPLERDDPDIAEPPDAAGPVPLLPEARAAAEPRPSIRVPAPPPQPALALTSADDPAARAPRIAALVLAAGRSSRMGPRNKLLAPVDGVPMVRRAVDAARGSRCDMVLMVTGHDAAAVQASAGSEDLATVLNLDFANGLASSLAAGLRALPADVDAVVVLLGDMPHIRAEHVDRLVAQFDPLHPAIVVPERDGRRGNPVLWPRHHFEEMLTLQGDAGARELILRHAREVVAVPMDTDAIFFDVDTPADLAGLEGP